MSRLMQLGYVDPELAPCMPDFLIISPPKTGSTWLARNLGDHPDIFIPELKELNYFGLEPSRLELNWYLQNFRRGRDRVKGEASTCYSVLPVSTIHLLHSLNPRLKLVLLMRDPVSRAWSHAKFEYLHRQANFEGCSIELNQVPDEMWCDNFRLDWSLCRGDYLGQLRRWLSVFPKDQIYVGFYEWIRDNPETLLENLFTFIGVQAGGDYSASRSAAVINPGLTKSVPDHLKGDLQHLFQERTRQLAAYLEREFGLIAPLEWTNTLPSDLDVSSRNSRAAAVPNPAEYIFHREFDDEHLAQLLQQNLQKDPQLIGDSDEGYLGYNIVYYKDRFHALAHSIGPIDLASLTDEECCRFRREGRHLAADSCGALKPQIHAAALKHLLAGAQDRPRLDPPLIEMPLSDAAEQMVVDDSDTSFTPPQKEVSVKFQNYDSVVRLVSRRRRAPEQPPVCYHKTHDPAIAPRVSIILLDWSCRESLHALDWLNRQDVPRDSYEIIWVELYDRVLPEPLEKADVVITLHQRGMYHKHKGYNAGVLAASGDVVTICDSDAVFPEDFISSILNSFCDTPGAPPKPLVLMHHQLRTALTYPDQLHDAAALKDQERWKWWPLKPNVGACISFRREDVVRFGGFDEHESYRGYLCGPYDLSWRLVNAEIPAVWHDPSTVLWHFAHPDPVGANKQRLSIKRLLENTYPHVNMHALTAVEHFSTGRVLPLKENPQIHTIRMARRQIGSEFERKFADLIPAPGLSRLQLTYLRMQFLADLAVSALWGKRARAAFSFFLGPLHRVMDGFRSRPPHSTEAPILVAERRRANIVQFGTQYYMVPKSLGPVNLADDAQRNHPAIRCSQRRWEVERLARRAA